MLFDELKCYNSVSFKLRSLKWGAEYRYSHSSHIYFKMLLAYYCDTQKQSSGEFAKFIGKRLCRSPFLNNVAGGRLIKKEAPTQCYLRTLLEDCFENQVFFHVFFVTVLCTHSWNNWNFSGKVYFSNNWAFFCRSFHAWFLYHEAKACWWVQQQDETAILLTK